MRGLIVFKELKPHFELHCKGESQFCDPLQFQQPRGFWGGQNPCTHIFTPSAGTLHLTRADCARKTFQPKGKNLFPENNRFILLSAISLWTTTGLLLFNLVYSYFIHIFLVKQRGKPLSIFMFSLLSDVNAVDRARSPCSTLFTQCRICSACWTLCALEDLSQKSADPPKKSCSKGLGGKSLFWKGTEGALKFSRALLSLHKKEKTTLRHREKENRFPFFIFNQVLYVVYVTSFSSSGWTFYVNNF